MPIRRTDTSTPLISATPGSGPRVSFVGSDPEAALLMPMPGFVGVATSFIGANPKAGFLSDATDGLMRLGPDPRAARAQTDAQAQYDHEASQAELQAIVETASKREQAERTAAALAMRQMRERSEVQTVSTGVSGGPRQPVSPMVHPKAAGLLARLSAQARSFQGRS